MSVTPSTLSMIDTIAAQVTPPGRGGVAIVRVSGPLVSTVMPHLLGKTLQARYVSFGDFYDSAKNVIDQGLAIYFANPHSFTGEDSLELQCHGSMMVVDQILQHLFHLGVRQARPGEFSERAFLNGKADLTQLEAIADLIHSTSIKAAQSAVKSMKGAFSKEINHFKDQLIYLRTYIEAAIDFTDEEIEFLPFDQIKQQVSDLIKQLSVIFSKAKQGTLLRDGVTMVIAGLPNAGKSSLLNELSGEPLAIVTDIPGTTRDLLRTDLLIDGLPIHVIDTAGLRSTHDPIEQEGIKRAYQALHDADFVCYVSDASESHEFELPEVLQEKPIIWVRNKIDLIDEKVNLIQSEPNQIHLSLSAKTQSGMDLLRDAIKTMAGYHHTGESEFLARRRHLEALERAQLSIQNANELLQSTAYLEMTAEELRQAQIALSEITGEFTTDDLLGNIFSSFCIGK